MIWRLLLRVSLKKDGLILLIRYTAPFGTYCKNMSMKEQREQFANLKGLQNYAIRYKCHDVDDQTMRKAILQWKRRLAAVAKQNGGPIQHIFC